jgi:hypothetical protein
MKRHALILTTTSPWARTGIAYENYEHARAADPETGRALYPQMLVIQLESWAVYEHADDPAATGGARLLSPPVVFDDILEREEGRNPQKFAVERRSQWAAVQEAFLDPDLVDQMYLPYCGGCGRSFRESQWQPAAGVCPWCSRSGPAITPAFNRQGVLAYVYMGHADPAERHDSFALCIAHLEHFSDPNGRQSAHIVVDYLHAWNPADYGGTLPYDEIEQDLAIIIGRYPTMKRFTFDQFGSPGTINGVRGLLKRAGCGVRVWKVAHTAANNKDREETVKEALALNWIHVPKDRLGPDRSCLLEQEMKVLQLINGRVMKQTTGRIRSDDLWTAFSVVVYGLLKHAHGRHVREALSATPLLGALPGGYHTRQMPDVSSIERPMSEARARLHRLSREYVAWGHPSNRRYVPTERQGLRRPRLP